MKTLLLLLTLTTFSSVAAQTCYMDTFGNTRCKSDSNVVTEYKSASRNNVVDNSHILGVEYTTRGNSHTNKVDTTGTTRDVDGNKWKTDTIGNTHGVTLYGVESVSTRDQYIISNEYGNMALVKPTSQYTPWTIYNNTLPMHKLTGSQAMELFLAGKNGRAMEYCIDGEWYDNQNFNFAASGVYRVKRKSGLDEFVEKMLTFYNNDVVDDKVVDMLKEAYDNGCRFV